MRIAAVDAHGSTTSPSEYGPTFWLVLAMFIFQILFVSLKFVNNQRKQAVSSSEPSQYMLYRKLAANGTFEHDVSQEVPFLELHLAAFVASF